MAEAAEVPVDASAPPGDPAPTVPAGAEGEASADSAAAPAEAAGDEYRVMQGPLFKRPGANPDNPKVIKITRKVGSKVKTTGKTWTGPSGGEWAQLDPEAEKPGWLLVEGPGFGIAGPLLEKCIPGEEEPMVLYVLSPVDDSKLCDICVKPFQKVKHAKNWIALHMPGLRPDRITCAKEKPSEKTHGMGLRNFPANWIIDGDTRFKDTPFKDGEEFVYFYMGQAAEDIEEEKKRQAELLAGKKADA